MPRIRSGTVADFDTVAERLMLSFAAEDPVHPPFEVMYPESFRAAGTAMAQWLVAEEDGEIVAGVQVIPQRFTLAGLVELPVGAVANVFCYPPFRGRGFMGLLLQAAVTRMERDGQALSVLGGERLRYGNYGWERAGVNRVLQLSPPMLRQDSRPAVSVMDIRQRRAGREDLARMTAAFGRKPYRWRRSRADLGRLLQRPGLVPWICDEPAAGFAYAIVRGGSMLEYAGTAAALDRVLRALVSARAFTVSLPPACGQTAAEAGLVTMAARYSVESTGMIRVISLERTFRAYAPLLTRRLHGWEGTLQLGVAGTGESVAIQSTAAGVRIVSPAPSAPELVVSLRELSLLLFGPFPPAQVSAADCVPLRCAFPLPFHWLALAHV